MVDLSSSLCKRLPETSMGTSTNSNNSMGGSKSPPPRCHSSLRRMWSELRFVAFWEWAATDPMRSMLSSCYPCWNSPKQNPQKISSISSISSISCSIPSVLWLEHKPDKWWFCIMWRFSSESLGVHADSSTSLRCGSWCEIKKAHQLILRISNISVLFFITIRILWSIQSIHMFLRWYVSIVYCQLLLSVYNIYIYIYHIYMYVIYVHLWYVDLCILYIYNIKVTGSISDWALGSPFVFHWPGWHSRCVRLRRAPNTGRCDWLA